MADTKSEVKFLLHQTEEQQLWMDGLGNFCVAITNRLDMKGNGPISGLHQYIACLMIETWKEIARLKEQTEQQLDELKEELARIEFKEID